MLFHVKMTVKLPLDMDPDKAAKLKADEKELAQRLQREGKWRHLWRIAGHYANYSVFDLASVEELHDTLMQLPLFPTWRSRSTGSAATLRRSTRTIADRRIAQPSPANNYKMRFQP